MVLLRFRYEYLIIKAFQEPGVPVIPVNGGHLNVMEGTMLWRFWRKPGPQELTAAVKGTLMSQFLMTSEMVDEMRSLEQAGLFEGKPVRFIRIFDPTLLSGRDASKSKYHDFQLQFSGDRKALMFDGHVAANGMAFLSDRRTPMTDFKIAQIPAAPRR